MSNILSTSRPVRNLRVKILVFCGFSKVQQNYERWEQRRTAKYNWTLQRGNVQMNKRMSMNMNFCGLDENTGYSNDVTGMFYHNLLA